MSQSTSAYVEYLKRLAQQDRAAIAELRRSLGFAPGAYPPSFPFVERFVARPHPNDPYRLALYLGAGLFALNPCHRVDQPIGRALAQQIQARYPQDQGKVTSLEQRFIALLAADADTVATHLRHAVQLLAVDEQGLDFAALIDDLAAWLDERAAERRDRIRQRWAIDFYRALTAQAPPASPEQTAETPTATE